MICQSKNLTQYSKKVRTESGKECQSLTSITLVALIKSICHYKKKKLLLDIKLGTCMQSQLLQDILIGKSFITSSSCLSFFFMNISIGQWGTTPFWWANQYVSRVGGSAKALPDHNGPGLAHNFGDCRLLQVSAGTSRCLYSILITSFIVFYVTDVTTCTKSINSEQQLNI